MADKIPAEKIGEMIGVMAGAIIGSTAVNIAQKAALIAGKVSKAARLAKVGAFLGAAADIGYGIYGTYEASTADTSDLRKGTQITGEITGMIANVLIGLVSGPAGIILMIIQFVTMLVEMFYNPFQNYYNNDLLKIRKQIDEELVKILYNEGVYWPLEVKPDITSEIINNKKKLNEFIDLQNKYFDNNGIIQKEQVLDEERQFIEDISAMKKIRRMYSPDGDSVVLQDPLTSTISIVNSTNENLLELLPYAAKAQRIQEYRKKYKSNYFITFQKYFSQNVGLVISCFFLIIFLSLIIIKYVKNEIKNK